MTCLAVRACPLTVAAVSESMSLSPLAPRFAGQSLLTVQPPLAAWTPRMDVGVRSQSTNSRYHAKQVRLDVDPHEKPSCTSNSESTGPKISCL